MNNHISTKAGLIIITVIFVAFIIVEYVVYKSATAEQANLSSNIAISNGKSCKPKAFAGAAQVKGWYIKESAEKVVRVADEDLSKLPSNGGNVKNKIQIIDLNPEIEKKLQGSSEENPQTLTITGFAVPCNGSAALASISYKDGIFRPYLK